MITVLVAGEREGEVRLIPCENFDHRALHAVVDIEASRWSPSCSRHFVERVSLVDCVFGKGIYWRTTRAEGWEYLEQIRRR